MSELSDTGAIQQQINALLRRGVVFSVVWLMGVGSVIALISGLRAKRLIEESQGTATGLGRVWWCLVVGGLGIAIWAPIVLIGLINVLRRS